MKLFSGNLNYMMTSITKINQDYDIDFSFIDKVLYYIVGIAKEDLLNALNVDSVEIKENK